MHPGYRHAAHTLLLAASLAGAATLSGAQQNVPPRPGIYNGGGMNPPGQADPNRIPMPHGSASDSDEDELSASMRVRREEIRKLQRRKSIVDSANRLVQATREFDETVKGRQLTPADEKRLDEIAKLAHQVREQMRGD